MVNRKFQPVLVLIVVVLFFAQGCAGRAAHPVQVAQSGDNEKNCKSLRKETKKIRYRLKKMIPAVKKADKKRTLLMVSGGLLIVPWFFLDLSDADKIEANAQRARYNYLVDRGVKRNCRLKIPQMKKFYFDDKGYKNKRNR
jgi:hypothetical protein